MIAPGIAKKVTWECVHFGTLLEGREELELCRAAGFAAIQVDVGTVKDASQLLSKIASAMEFPDYFGTNWDALIDCLRDLSWLNPKGVLLVLENSKALWHELTLAGSLVEVWLLCAEYWARDDVPFHLGFTRD